MTESNRATFPVAIHLFFLIGNQILLLRRANTGYEDGNYSVVAGHVETGETVTEAAIREAREEVGVDISRESLTMAGVMHRRAGDERVDFFFKVQNWSGTIVNQEPNKCDEIRWASDKNLPSNIVPYVKHAIELSSNSIWYEEYGW